MHCHAICAALEDLLALAWGVELAINMHELVRCLYEGMQFTQQAALKSIAAAEAVSCAVQVEFNKAALSLSDSIAADQKKAALNRLLKV